MAGHAEGEPRPVTPGDVIARLDALEASVSGLVRALATQLDAVQAAQQPPQHTHGLCQDAHCAICIEQAIQIRDAAFAQGQAAAVEEVRAAITAYDQALLAQGQPALGPRIVQVIKQGEAIAAQSRLQVSITG